MSPRVSGDTAKTADPDFGSFGVTGIPGYENSLRGHAQMLGAARLYDKGDSSAAAVNAMAQPLSQLMASVGISIIVSLALLQSLQNQTGVGEFASFVTALLFMSSRLRHLSDVMQPITNALVVARGQAKTVPGWAKKFRERRAAEKAAKKKGK